MSITQVSCKPALDREDPLAKMDWMDLSTGEKLGLKGLSHVGDSFAETSNG